MELCCASAAASRSISSPFPRHRPSHTTLRSHPSFSSFTLPRDLLFNINFSSRSIRGIRVPRSMIPEEDSSYASVVKEKDEERTVDDGEGVVEDKSRGSSVIEYSENPVAGELSDSMDFLSKLDLKLEAGETYSILAYGVGAFLTLWLSSAVVGALDSLPVLPKLMEIIGLGFTVWFSYRYLIFKRNRDELFAKIDDLKEQILGPSE